MCICNNEKDRMLGSQTVVMSGGEKDKLMSLPTPLIHLHKFRIYFKPEAPRSVLGWYREHGWKNSKINFKPEAPRLVPGWYWEHEQKF